MARKRKKDNADLMSVHKRRLLPLVEEAPWILRITEWKGKPPPLFIIKQRRFPEEDPTKAKKSKAAKNSHAGTLKDRGLLYGDSQRRCLPVVRRILSRVQDDDQQTLDLGRFLASDELTFRGNLPLDEEAGAKLALIFKLQERVKELDRVELIARRVDRFTQEEAAYWLSRMSDFGTDANRWATSGMKIMLGGGNRDPAVEKMLEQLRTRY